MKVSRIDDNRFRVALELLRAYREINFNDVVFCLNHKDNSVEVRSLTSWHNNLTEQTALTDIQRGIETFEYLVTNSFSFAEVVEGHTPRFSLIDDYGMASVELCYMDNGRVRWN